MQRYSQPTPLSLTTSKANLRRLAMIRLIFITAVLIALAFAYQTSQPNLIQTVHLSTLSVYAALTLLTYWRLQQSWPVTDLEYFFQLLVDLTVLTVLLYFSGGASNPFVSYYLVPLTISAAILPWRFTWVIAGLSMTAYSLMLVYYQPALDIHPVVDHSSHINAGVNLHILGMWFTFTLSASLITYFVVKMAAALRQQEDQFVSNREDELRNEQILAVATLAAGTAHELGTPLSTMTILIDELEQEYQQPKQLGLDLRLLKKQIESCKHILQGLVITAEAHSHGKKTVVSISHYIEQLLDHWQVFRPNATFQLTLHDSVQSRQLHVDPTLEQAICNLLNNAADANDQMIDVTVQCLEDSALISIRDHGAGIPPQVAEQLGKPFVSTKGKGLGLGLFLSHATINRYGGSIELHNHADGGTLAELRLPLSNRPPRKL